MIFDLVYIEKTVYGDDTAGYGIYLINNSELSYHIDYSTGGFMTYDDEVIKLEGKDKDLGMIAPYTKILIEENDLGSLDMTGFIDLEINGENSYQIHFNIGKGSPNGDPIRLEGLEGVGTVMEYEITEIETLINEEEIDEIVDEGDIESPNEDINEPEAKKDSRTIDKITQIIFVILSLAIIGSLIIFLPFVFLVLFLIGLLVLASSGQASISDVIGVLILLLIVGILLFIYPVALVFIIGLCGLLYVIFN